MFKDVPVDAWYSEALRWCVENGIMYGFPDGTFKPDEPVTRAQIATLLYLKAKRDGDFSDVAPTVRQSVVTITTPAGLGSGAYVDQQAFFDDAGYILTNNHVVGDFSEVTIIKDGSPNYLGKVVKKDSYFDLALVKVAVKKPILKLAKRAARYGEAVGLIGSPAGHTDTLSVGQVSHDDRSEGRNFQTNALINPGNSGGPVFNEYGDLVGVVVARWFDAQKQIVGLGYGIKYEHVKRFLNL